MKKILTFVLLSFPALASAQDFGLAEMEGKVHLGNKPLDDTIAGIINIALGFLGILTTLIILFGGFKWMTSYGSSDKIDEAKKLISAGVIGLVLVLVSYAIAQFVLNSLINETI
jgi:hypothetical protein